MLYWVSGILIRIFCGALGEIIRSISIYIYYCTMKKYVNKCTDQSDLKYREAQRKCLLDQCKEHQKQYISCNVSRRCMCGLRVKPGDQSTYCLERWQWRRTGFEEGVNSLLPLWRRPRVSGQPYNRRTLPLTKKHHGDPRKSTLVWYWLPTATW